MAGLGINSVSASPSSLAEVLDLLSRVDVPLALKAATSALQAKNPRDAKVAAKAALIEL
jgi:phosphoenolpyruvate-protein kinase (PTS system EI component)